MSKVHVTVEYSFKIVPPMDIGHLSTLDKLTSILWLRPVKWVIAYINCKSPQQSCRMLNSTAESELLSLQYSLHPSSLP